MLNQADITGLRSFLHSPAGVNIVSELRSRRPKIKDDPSLAQGWEECLEEMNRMSNESTSNSDLGGDKLMTVSLEDDRREDRKPTIDQLNTPHTGRQL